MSNKDFNSIVIENSGYNNVQVMRGYIIISVADKFEELVIDVTETTSNTQGQSTFMHFSFDGPNSDVDKEAVLEYFGDSIEYDKESDSWEIVDDVLLEDLFSNYGTNGGWI